MTIRLALWLGLVLGSIEGGFTQTTKVEQGFVSSYVKTRRLAC